MVETEIQGRTGKRIITTIGSQLVITEALLTPLAVSHLEVILVDSPMVEEIHEIKEVSIERINLVAILRMEEQGSSRNRKELAS